MSEGAWSQFSPKRQQPTPTTATLSRSASFLIRRALQSYGGLLGHRSPLPVVVRAAAHLVDAAELELDRHPELHRLRGRVHELQVDARAVDLRDGDDRRRVGRREEEVERVGDDA